MLQINSRERRNLQLVLFQALQIIVLCASVGLLPSFYIHCI